MFQEIRRGKSSNVVLFALFVMVVLYSMILYYYCCSYYDYNEDFRRNRKETDPKKLQSLFEQAQNGLEHMNKFSSFSDKNKTHLKFDFS